MNESKSISIEELDEFEIEIFAGGVAPFLIAYFGSGFALGVTSSIAAYAATRKQ